MHVDEFQAADGNRPKYISIGLASQDADGNWHDLRKGCTIRRSEIRDLIRALERADEIIDTAMNAYTMSDAEYAKTLDWGRDDVVACSPEELEKIIIECRAKYKAYLESKNASASSEQVPGGEVSSPGTNDGGS